MYVYLSLYARTYTHTPPHTTPTLAVHCTIKLKSLYIFELFFSYS